MAGKAAEAKIVSDLANAPIVARGKVIAGAELSPETRAVVEDIHSAEMNRYAETMRLGPRTDDIHSAEMNRHAETLRLGPRPDDIHTADMNAYEKAVRLGPRADDTHTGMLEDVVQPLRREPQPGEMGPFGVRVPERVSGSPGTFGVPEPGMVAPLRNIAERAVAEPSRGVAGQLRAGYETAEDLENAALTGLSRKRFLGSGPGQAERKAALSEFRLLADSTAKVEAAVSKAAGPMTPEHWALLKNVGAGEGDWRAFSQARGYTAENMDEFQRYLDAAERAKALGIEEDALAEIAGQSYLKHSGPFNPVAGGADNRYIPPPSLMTRLRELFKPTMAPTPLSQLSPATGASLIAKVAGAIRQSKDLTRELEPIRSAERGRRVAEGTRIYATTPGTYEARLGASVEAGVGPLPNVGFEPIGVKLAAGERDELFKRMIEAPGLEYHEWHDQGRIILRKVLDTGERLQKNELDLVTDIFPELGGALRRRQQHSWEVAAGFGVGLANAAKSLKSAIDFSAPGRQGFLLLSEAKGGEAIYKMLRAGFSDTEAARFATEVKSSPHYALGRKLHLGITTTTPGNILKEEEAFIGNVFRNKIVARDSASRAERAAIQGINLPLAPVRKLTKASENAYVTYLNVRRQGIFDKYADLWIPPPPVDQLALTPVEAAARAKFEHDMGVMTRVINVFSGRGYLGTTGSQIDDAAGLLNLPFFSPRQVMARLEAPFMPLYALQQGSPRVALMAARNLVASYGAAIGIVSLAAASGLASVETDSRSPDWGLIRVGNTRVDLFAGFKQVFRMVAQMKSAQQKRPSGKVVDVDRFTVQSRFWLNKASPAAGLGIGLLKQKKWLDDETVSTEKESSSFYPTDTLGRLEQLLAPMSMDDLWQAVREEGTVAGGLLAAPAFFGAGVSTYKTRTRKGTLPGLSY